MRLFQVIILQYFSFGYYLQITFLYQDQIKENLHHFHENFNLKISDEGQQQPGGGSAANIVSPSGGGGNPPTVSINANLAPSGKGLDDRFV